MAISTIKAELRCWYSVGIEVNQDWLQKTVLMHQSIGQRNEPWIL